MDAFDRRFEDDVQRLRLTAPGEARPRPRGSWENLAVIGAGASLLALFLYNRYTNQLEEAKRQRAPLDEATAAKLKDLFRHGLTAAAEYEAKGNLAAAVASLSTALGELATIQRLWPDDVLKRNADIDVPTWRDSVESRRALLMQRLAGNPPPVADEQPPE
jgi:hypothetical protein